MAMAFCLGERLCVVLIHLCIIITYEQGTVIMLLLKDISNWKGYNLYIYTCLNACIELNMGEHGIQTLLH